MSPNVRTVVTEPRFATELAACLRDARRADEFMSGIVWILARTPDIGQQARPGSPVWVISIEETLGVPALTLYYTFNDTEVRLLSVQMVMRNGSN